MFQSSSELTSFCRALAQRGYGTRHVPDPRMATGRGPRMPLSDGIQQTWWSTGTLARGAGALDPHSKPCTACAWPTGMAASLRGRLRVLSKHRHQTETSQRPVPGGAEKLAWREPDPALGFLEWVCPRFRPRRGWRDPTLPGLPPARLLSTRREDSSWAWCFEVQTADAGACDPTANALQSPRGRIWKPGRRGDGALSSR